MTKKRFALLLLVVLLTACSARTKIVGTWREPSGPPGPYGKVGAIVLAQNDDVCRIAEDEFVKSLPRGVEGVRSYAVIPKEDEGNVDKVVERLRSLGVEGATVMRLVSQDTQMAYDRGSYWRPNYTFQSYYGTVSATYFDPGYLVPETAVHIETAVYSVTDSKLVWTGYSETINPNNAKVVIDDVVRLVVARLRQEKILP